MGVQQCMHSRWRSMEGSVQNQSRIVQTNSDVLRPMQFSCDFPSHLIYLQDIFPCWMKLRHLRPRTPCDYLSTGWIATLHPRITSHNNYPLRSQEPHLLLGSKELTQRQARWSLYLSEFDIKLVHTPGTKMILSDALSQQPDFCPDEYHDNEDIVMLPEHMFLQLIDLDLPQKIVLLDNLDQQALDALTFLFNYSLTVPSPLKQDLKDWTVHTDNNHQYLFYQGRAYIPQNDDLQQDIVQNFHDHITAGHPRELGTYNAIRQHYWWPGLRMFIKNYVQGCSLCQQFKIDHSPMKPALLPTEGAHVPRPFAYCSMDLITDLPPADGFDSILVVVDQGLSKGVILIPCTKTLTSEDTARLLPDNLYKRFRLPDKIISDQGPQFASKVFTELLKLLGIKSALSTAYHPQTNGTTERTNQEIEVYLSIYCASQPKEWPRALSTLKFTHNNRWHADRTQTLFELMFGESPITIPLSFKSTKYPTMAE